MRASVWWLLSVRILSFLSRSLGLRLSDSVCLPDFLHLCISVHQYSRAHTSAGGPELSQEQLESDIPDPEQPQCNVQVVETLAETIHAAVASADLKLPPPCVL